MASPFYGCYNYCLSLAFTGPLSIPIQKVEAGKSHLASAQEGKCSKSENISVLELDPMRSYALLLSILGPGYTTKAPQSGGHSEASSHNTMYQLSTQSSEEAFSLTPLLQLFLQHRQIFMGVPFSILVLTISLCPERLSPHSSHHHLLEAAPGPWSSLPSTHHVVPLSPSLFLCSQQESKAHILLTSAAQCLGFAWLEQGERDHNSSPAREQNWTENEFDELIEVGFRRWVITNSSNLKEHFLTQCKEAKNLEKRLEELLTRITSCEKNINDLMELKNTAQELREAYTSIIAKSIKQKKG
ncbi:LINE-1 retrotransposable element ORF1 protein [Plecturocebus cupreus]